MVKIHAKRNLAPRNLRETTQGPPETPKAPQSAAQDSHNLIITYLDYELQRSDSMVRLHVYAMSVYRCLVGSILCYVGSISMTAGAMSAATLSIVLVYQLSEFREQIAEVRTYLGICGLARQRWPRKLPIGRQPQSCCNRDD